MSVAVPQDVAVTTAIYKICYMLSKHMKPFTNVEIVKECFPSTT